MGEPEDPCDVMRVNEVFKGYATGHSASLAALPGALSTRGIFRPDRHVVYTCKTKQGDPGGACDTPGSGRDLVGGPDNASVRKCGDAAGGRAPPH